MATTATTVGHEDLTTSSVRLLGSGASDGTPTNHFRYGIASPPLDDELIGEPYVGPGDFYAILSLAGYAPGTRIYYQAFLFIGDLEFYYGAIKSFTIPVEGAHAKKIVTLEAVRNLEMTTMGRFFVDEEGNARFAGRFARTQ